MDNMKNDIARCAQCSIHVPDRLCQNEDGKAPPSCPTQKQSDVIEAARQEYAKPDVLAFAHQASMQEGDGYGRKELGYERVVPIKPRILEVMEFARKMGYRRLGLAFCIGLRKEARVVEALFRSHGFDVASAVCKIGRIPKEIIHVDEAHKIRPGQFEAMCNPIGQARVLAQAGTEFNVALGLCVGHDSLFFQYSAAPCTVLAVKDRLLGHNPLAAVYNLDSYHRALKATDPAD